MLCWDNCILFGVDIEKREGHKTIIFVVPEGVKNRYSFEAQDERPLCINFSQILMDLGYFDDAQEGFKIV